MASRWTDYDLATLSALFFLGHRPGHEQQPIIYPRERKERAHLAYYGTTQSGKTHGIEYALQQLALAPARPAGFCYIDPHGTSYWRMASFLRQYGITEKVLYWDINDPDYIVTYDPFAARVPPREQSPSFIAGNLTSALLATLGRTADAHEQPHLKTMTEDGLMALLSLNLAFLLAPKLFDPSETAIKEAVARRLSESNLVATVADMPRFKDRREELAPPYRRFKNLFRDDRLRLSFTCHGVDFRKLMDEGWIVLVNTEQRDQTDEAVTLFTRLLVNQFFMAAKSRGDEKEPHPFFLAIDEASRYLTTDTAQILSQTTKFGLYLLLGMQSIDQARLENEESYVAIRKNVNAEIVMRLTDFEEKQHFARRFFADSFDPKKIKDEQIVAIPHTVEHTLYGSAESDPSSETRFESDDPDRPGGVSRTTGSVHVTNEIPGFHVEYTYQRVPRYYTPEEQEREAMKVFGVRSPGAAQRFGIARVNEALPEAIEIPELPSPMYSRKEMAPYLATQKRTQPATLARHEAEERYAQLEREQLERLQAPKEREPSAKPLREPSPGKTFSFTLPRPEKPAQPKPATSRKAKR